jgi:hypothetical protein
VPTYNPWPDLFEDIDTALTAAWPEITGWWKGRDIEDTNFIIALREGSITPPFAVVDVPAARAVDRDAMATIVYEVMPTAYYITEADSATDWPTVLDEKMNLLEEDLTTRFFQVMRVMDVGLIPDVSILNRLNERFNTAEQSFQSGSFTWMCWVGKAP